MGNSLRIAVAQPVSVLGDVEENALHHAASVTNSGARVVVFPELSLTGYSMQAEPISPADPRLSTIVRACSATDSVALVGAATEGHDGLRRISTMRIDASGASIAYSKMFLGGDEPPHFAAGTEPSVVDIDGWRLGLAICKDTGIPEHAEQTMALRVDAYVAGVCETAEEEHVQPQRAARIVETHCVWVIYSSFAGPTGGGFQETAGHSAIWRPDGGLVTELGPGTGVTAGATLTKVARS